MKQRPILGKDIPWSVIDGELCRVIRFTPFAKIENKKVRAVASYTPYAFLTVECKKFKQNADLWVTHKIDFINLSEAFGQRKIKDGEEVLIIWSVNHYKYKLYKIFSFIFPKIWVMICPKNAYEIETNPNFRPELTGEARFLAFRPIKEWEPEVMG